MVNNMDKIKIVNIINIILIILSLIIQIVFLFIWKINLSYYYLTSLNIAILSLLCVVLLIIRALVSMDYTIKRFTMAMVAIPAFISVLAYYLVKYLGNYEKYIVLYWILLLMIIPILIVFHFLNKIPIKKKNGPKIIQNNKN